MHAIINENINEIILVIILILKNQFLEQHPLQQEQQFRKQQLQQHSQQQLQLHWTQQLQQHSQQNSQQNKLLIKSKQFWQAWIITGLSPCGATGLSPCGGI